MTRRHKKAKALEDAGDVLHQAQAVGLVFVTDEQSGELQVVKHHSMAASQVLRLAQQAITLALKDARKAEAKVLKRTQYNEPTGWKLKVTDYDN